MKSPVVGELWLDDGAMLKDRSVRLLLITGIREAHIDAVAVEGPSPSATGIPIAYLRERMSWQGYWSLSHEKLERLKPPFDGSPLADLPGSRNATQLHGSADLVSSIIPSWRPNRAQLLDKNRRPVPGADLQRPIRRIPPGNPYLVFTYYKALIGMTSPESLRELWYQKQGNVWFLVRTLILPD